MRPRHAARACDHGIESWPHTAIPMHAGFMQASSLVYDFSMLGHLSILLGPPQYRLLNSVCTVHLLLSTGVPVSSSGTVGGTLLAANKEDGRKTYHAIKIHANVASFSQLLEMQPLSTIFVSL